MFISKRTLHMLESRLAYAKDDHEQLQKDVVALREAYNALFDFLATELGFKAKRGTTWIMGSPMFEVVADPRVLQYTEPEPSIVRTKPPIGEPRP